MLYRQGDIYIESVAAIPESAAERQNHVLADGELTGHQHRITDFRSALVLEDRGQLYVNVVSEFADVVHEEHGTIQLERGLYRVWRQREFDPLFVARERYVKD